MQPRLHLGRVLRRQLFPVAVAIGVGLVTLLDQFISNSALDVIGATLVAWTALIAGFALLLGLINLLLFHVRRIIKREPQWFSSILVLVTALLVFLIALPSGGTSTASLWVLQYLYRPLEASFLALVVFFIGTAVYRALRVRGPTDTSARRWEMALFAVSAVVVLIGSVPFTSLLTPLLPAAREWIVNVPALAGVRGILLGVALGVLATGLRLLTGIDRPYAE